MLPDSLLDVVQFQGCGAIHDGCSGRADTGSVAGSNVPFAQGACRAPCALISLNGSALITCDDNNLCSVQGASWYARCAGVPTVLG